MPLAPGCSNTCPMGPIPAGPVCSQAGPSTHGVLLHAGIRMKHQRPGMVAGALVDRLSLAFQSER